MALWLWRAKGEKIKRGRKNRQRWRCLSVHCKNGKERKKAQEEKKHIKEYPQTLKQKKRWGVWKGLKKKTYTHKDTHTTSLALSPFLGLSFYFSRLDAPGQITISPSQKHFSSRDYKGKKTHANAWLAHAHTHAHSNTIGCSPISSCHHGSQVPNTHEALIIQTSCTIMLWHWRPDEGGNVFLPDVG